MIRAAVGLTALATTGLLISEYRGTRWRLLFKPVASAGFVALALIIGPDGAYGAWLMTALGLCAVGDVLLLRRRWFIRGLVVFLTAHIAYSAAFIVAGTRGTWIAAAALPLLVALWAVGRGLLRRVESKLRPAVAGYMVVISIMVAAAVGTAGAGGPARTVIGALMFYFSDLAVARDRFMSPGFANRLWGLPLYYGAQLILASTA